MCHVSFPSHSFLVREVTKVARRGNWPKVPQLADGVTVCGHSVKVNSLLLAWPGAHRPPPHFYRKNNQWTDFLHVSFPQDYGASLDHIRTNVKRKCQMTQKSQVSQEFHYRIFASLLHGYVP